MKKGQIKISVILYGMFIFTIVTLIGYIVTERLDKNYPSSYILIIYLIKLLGLLLLINSKKKGLYIYYLGYMLMILQDFKFENIVSITVGIMLNVVLIYTSLRKNWIKYK